MAAARADVPPVALDAALALAESLPRLHSLLVSWRDELVLEAYFNGARASRPANIKSASKSLISALVGVAIDRGWIEGVDQPIATFFDDRFAADDPGKRDITIEDLLTMRSGLQSTSGRNYGAWVQSGNWVRYVLSRPLEHEPGVTMSYSTGSTHVLSAILTRVSGMSTWELAQSVLGKPLGSEIARWPRDPQGIYFGGNDMLLTPRQMVAFGELYLDRGLFEGSQIVPEAWIDASFVPRTRSRWDDDRLYGYGWWMRPLDGHQSYYAWGYGGQFIFVVPDLDLVVVTTSAATPGDDRRGHRRGVAELIEDIVVPRIAEAAGATAATSP